MLIVNKLIEYRIPKVDRKKGPSDIMYIKGQRGCTRIVYNTFGLTIFEAEN